MVQDPQVCCGMRSESRPFFVAFKPLFQAVVARYHFSSVERPRKVMRQDAAAASDVADFSCAVPNKNLRKRWPRRVAK